jgi:hypothetical protein
MIFVTYDGDLLSRVLSAEKRASTCPDVIVPILGDSHLSTTPPPQAMAFFCNVLFQRISKDLSMLLSLPLSAISSARPFLQPLVRQVA